MVAGILLSIGYVVVALMGWVMSSFADAMQTKHSGLYHAAVGLFWPMSLLVVVIRMIAIAAQERSNGR